MATPHNQAAMGDIAEVVLMPGDPLRAKLVAETYLTDVTCFNEVRGMLGYTGFYQGVRISVMGSGMGCPSIGIYSHELYYEYGVKCIIRIGSTGGMIPELQLGEIVLAQGVSTDSNFAEQYELPGTFAPLADFGLLRTAAEHAERMNLPIHVGNVLSSDIFYHDISERSQRWTKMGVLAVEMEALALYCTAARAGKKALCMLTVSDNLVTQEAMDAKERQESFHSMMKLALETAIRA